MDENLTESHLVEINDENKDQNNDDQPQETSPPTPLSTEQPANEETNETCISNNALELPVANGEPTHSTDSSNDSNDSSQSSRFDSACHCRYCFRRVREKENASACRCTGLLCEKCLAHELRMTISRQDGIMKCTVCNHRYNVVRQRLDQEKRCIPFFKFFIQKTFPGDSRDLSVFYEWDRGVIMLPMGAANALVMVEGCWIAFTLLVEFFSGSSVGEGRILALFLDLYLMLEVLRITSYIDFPERFWMGVFHAVRMSIMLTWSILTWRKSLQIHVVTSDTETFNWKWLLLYVIGSCVYLVWELPRFVKDLRRRAVRDGQRLIPVVVKAPSGKEIGPLQLHAYHSPPVEENNRSLDLTVLAL